MLFHIQQRPLDVNTSGIAHQRAIGADHTVAGGDDGDGITVVGHANGAECLGTAYGCGQLLVGACRAIRDLAESSPDTELEGGAALVKGEGEVATVPGEVFGELRGSLSQQGCLLRDGVGRKVGRVARDEVDHRDAAATVDDEQGAKGCGMDEVMVHNK